MLAFNRIFKCGLQSARGGAAGAKMQEALSSLSVYEEDVPRMDRGCIGNLTLSPITVEILADSGATDASAAGPTTASALLTASWETVKILLFIRFATGSNCARLGAHREARESSDGRGPTTDVDDTSVVSRPIDLLNPFRSKERITMFKLLNFVTFLSMSWFVCAPLQGQIIDTEQVRRNIALDGTAETNGELWSLNWSADDLIDGIANVVHGDGAGGVTGFPEEPGFSYTIDLGAEFQLDGIDLLPRQDACCPDRLRDFRVGVHADNRGRVGDEVWGVDLFPDEDADGGPGSRISLMADDGTGNFMGRYVVVTTNQDPVDEYELQLSEVEIYAGIEERPINFALGAEASTNGTMWAAPWDDLSRITDGNLTTAVHGDGAGGNAGFPEPEGFYYEIDLGQTIEIAELDVYPRTDGCCPDRLTNYAVSIHPDEGGSPGDAVWTTGVRLDGSFADNAEPDQLTPADDPAGSMVGQWLRITSLADQDEIDDGFVDYRLQISDVQVFGHASTGASGDFDMDGDIDADDIDALTAAIAAGDTSGRFDLDGNGSVDADDRVFMISETLNTYLGDSNLDGEFSSSDFVAVFIVGHYEDGIDGNSGWAEGDWNGDFDVSSSDFVAAFIEGGFEQGPRAASAVPEPNGLLMCAIFALCCQLRGRGRRSP